MPYNEPAPEEPKPLASPAPPPPVGLMARAGVKPTSTVQRCGASSDGSGWLMVFIIFLLIVLFGRI